jgi:hypothetical protein
MRLTLTLTGGVAGARVRRDLDGSALTARDRDHLERLLAEAGFWSAPARIESRSPAPDRLRYRLAVEDGERRREVLAAEEAMPEPLRALVRWVEARSKPARR